MVLPSFDFLNCYAVLFGMSCQWSLPVSQLSSTGLAAHDKRCGSA